ncbi:MAG: Ig-like domain-containing protein, partial [Treponemataceae bacterium]|nr:Ig-like domain-containing protein [Treponemataceae bacterium]
MKRTTWLAALATMMALLATGCDNGSSEPEPVAVESVTLNVTTLALAPGAKEKVTATVLPENADDKTVVWSSSDLAVATVGEDGTVTARVEGTATITAHAGGKTATCAVTVNKITEKPEPVAVESVTLNATTLTLEPGKTMTLTATVSDDGTVTAVSIGEASITAQAGDKEATCTVTVKQIL